MRLASTGATLAALVTTLAAASWTTTVLGQTPPPSQQGQQTGRAQGQGQTQGRAGGQGRGQGQAGGARQPARDTTDQAAPKDGTGVITGTVVGSDTGRAVRRVRVNLAGGDLRSSRSAVTDDAGRFSFAALPPGRYTLNASKPGYVNVMYGQKRPGRPGTPIQLADGQQLNGVKMVLPKGGVLTGIVLDENGDPTPGTQVSAWRWEMRTGEKRLTQAGSDQTDDRGQYRIYGLLPGDYVVRATPRNALGDLRQVVQDVAQSVLGGRGGGDALGALGQLMGGRGGQAGRGAGPGGGGPGAGLGNLQQLMSGRGGQGQAMEMLQGLMGNTSGADDNGVAYAPVYYPGTTTSTAAATVPLGVSEERQSLDFQLQLVQTATVSGSVTSGDGDVSGVQLTLVNETEQAIGGGMNMTRVQADGTFTFTNIAPGQYVLQARARRGGAGGRGGRGGGAQGGTPDPNTPAAPPEVLWGEVAVAVSGSSVTGVSVTLQPGMKVGGHLAFDGGAMPADLTRVRVALAPSGGGGGLDLAQNAPAQIDASGRFTISGVSPGRYTLRVQGQVQGFTLRSAVTGGRDILDFPLEVKPNEDVADIAVTMTTQSQELSGSLLDNTGNPATDYTVIVFPAESQYWTPQSRRIVSARPGTDGKFFARNLPTGEYLIAAVTDVEPGEWFDPAFLTQLRAAAARVTLNAGDKRTQDLKISGGGLPAAGGSPSR
jgi:protocatechuate 3,4-dioxygenase beta subunit